MVLQLIKIAEIILQGFQEIIAMKLIFAPVKLVHPGPYACPNYWDELAFVTVQIVSLLLLFEVKSFFNKLFGFRFNP